MKFMMPIVRSTFSFFFYMGAKDSFTYDKNFLDLFLFNVKKKKKKSCASFLPFFYICIKMLE